MNIETIIKWVSLGITLLPLVVYFFILIYEKVTKKKVSTETKETVNHLIKENNIMTLIPELIKKAENLFAGTNKAGISKLTYVLYKLQQYAHKNNEELNEEVAIEYIENILSTPQKNLTLETENEAENNNEIKGE